jgi:hypothetical protein
MSYRAEEIPLPTGDMPLPWLVEPWVAASHGSGAATPSQSPLAQAPTQGQPQRQNIASSQPTAHRTSTMAIRALVGLGLLALVIILVTLTGAGHGAAFSGAHGLHGMAR